MEQVLVFVACSKTQPFICLSFEHTSGGVYHKDHTCCWILILGGKLQKLAPGQTILNTSQQGRVMN